MSDKKNEHPDQNMGNDGEASSVRGSMLEPVRKIRLYESIVKQIQKLITGGTLKPGDRLPPERELAEELQVSRTSIREALRALEMMGYLESRVGVKGGTYIKEVSFSNIVSPFSESLLQHDDFVVDLLETRLVLEIEVVRLAAVRRTEEHLEKLEKAVDLMEKDIRNGGVGLACDNEFHKVLANAAANRVLQEFVNLCGDLLEVEREDHLRNQEGEPQRALQQHKDMVVAIRAKDSGKAQRIMEEHLLKPSEVIRMNRKSKANARTPTDSES